MGETGLVEVADAETLAGPRLAVPGVVRTITNDGSRSFPVDVQALVARSAGPPRRVAYQVSPARLALLLAVLEARCGIDLDGRDVYAAAAGDCRPASRGSTSPWPSRSPQPCPGSRSTPVSWPWARWDSLVSFAR